MGDFGRMLREVSALLNSPPPGYVCRLRPEDIRIVDMVLHGPEDTPYEGRSFKMCLNFPEEYPRVAPRIKFITPIYHPNVNVKGYICLSLQREWKPAMRVAQFLHLLRLKIVSPEIDNPLMPEIAVEYAYEKENFYQKARKWAHEFGFIFRTIEELIFFDPISFYEEEDRKWAASSCKPCTRINQDVPRRPRRR